MFQRILLPLDLTDKHETAVRAAGELARQNNASVILLHVVELIPGLDQQEEKSFYSRLERRARDHLARVVAGLARQQVAAQPEVIFGHRVQDTVRFAGEHKIDVIILTSPAFHPDQPASSLGSMAWKISLLAPCAVLLVKGEQKGPMP